MLFEHSNDPGCNNTTLWLGCLPARYQGNSNSPFEDIISNEHFIQQRVVHLVCIQMPYPL